MLEDSYILISVHRIVKDLDRETTRIAASCGLTFPQFMVLEALLHRDSMSVGEIKDHILSSNGTIPVIIDNLVKQGMVRRFRDPGDHRRSLVKLTDNGRALIKQVCPENDRMIRERFSVWSEEEKKNLINLLSLYHKEIQAQEGDNNA